MHTGTGSSQIITDQLDFQPDLVWVKSRTGTYGSYNHNLIDAVRGVTKTITTNNTSVEATTATSLTAFNADGSNITTTIQSGVYNKDGDKVEVLDIVNNKAVLK